MQNVRRDDIANPLHPDRIRERQPPAPAPAPVDWYQRRCACETAIRELRNIRDYLARTGAREAVVAVRRALKSVDGARRHADGQCTRRETGPRVEHIAEEFRTQNALLRRQAG